MPQINLGKVQGKSIKEIQKISSAGLTDTYQVILDDGTPAVGTFMVTNGAQGPTGQQGPAGGGALLGDELPLMDALEADAGESLDAARADHVHPVDTAIRDSVTDLEYRLNSNIHSVNGMLASEDRNLSNRIDRKMRTVKLVPANVQLLLTAGNTGTPNDVRRYICTSPGTLTVTGGTNVPSVVSFEIWYWSEYVSSVWTFGTRLVSYTTTGAAVQTIPTNTGGNTQSVTCNVQVWEVE